MLASLQRILSVARKEVLHIFRDRQTLFFTLFFPVVELVMLGYGIEMKVTNIPTVILDQARTQESRDLLRRFENSEDFKIVREVHSEAELSEVIVAGEVRVGIKIPENYSRRLEAGETAQVQLLVDGSVSSVAAEAVNVGNALALNDSLARTLGNRPLPVEARPRVLFNPDMRSANFFIPGLLVILVQIMGVSLAATAVVREKEKGTLEQLFMTPVRAGELLVGKMLPYLVLTYVEFCAIAVLMRYLFQVPIAGSFGTLLIMTLPFGLTMLAWGLLISTRVETRDAANQMALGMVMPCAFLSGYVFPIESMPVFLQWFAHVLPTTWLIDASRGVILRGAGWQQLWPHAAILTGMAVLMIVYSVLRFRKRLS
jgi:ABC-2 type transport system permease protein